MFKVISAVGLRIVSNSYLNVFQKILTGKGENSSVVNFYTYAGLTLIGLCFLPFLNPNITKFFIANVLIMGLLGALGNYFIIKALSIGELSSLAPINSYKPITALIIGYFYLNEIPSLKSTAGIFLIISGTLFLFGKNNKPNLRAVLYRFLALLFSGGEAVFIKKVIILSDINSAFLFWAFSGFVFSFLLALTAKKSFKISSVKHQILLVLSVFLMQYSTNYVFSYMNVGYALALFQLSTLVSVFLGVNIFNEKGLVRKILSSIIMILGAVIIILNSNT